MCQNYINISISVITGITSFVTDLVGGESSVGLQGEGRSAGFGEEFHQVGVTSFNGVVQCRPTTLAFLKGTRRGVLHRGNLFYTELKQRYMFHSFIYSFYIFFLHKQTYTQAHTYKYLSKSSDINFVNKSKIRPEIKKICPH